MREVLGRAILAFGFVVAAFACLYVPYSAVADTQGRNPTAHAGYGFLWQPPEREDACMDAFDIGNPQMCSVKVNATGAMLGVAAACFLFSGLAIGIGLTRMEKQPRNSDGT